MLLWIVDCCYYFIGLCVGGQVELWNGGVVEVVPGEGGAGDVELLLLMWISGVVD